jgi:KaiC/GvpD/RAD55 family RecA-like ATPase
MGNVKTGVEGLDSLFAEGGFPEGTSILILGGPEAQHSTERTGYLYLF